LRHESGITRRRLLAAFAAMFAAGGPARAGSDDGPVRVGMTPAFLHDQHGLLGEWREYMARKLRRPVVFLHRDSYRETMDLIRLDQLDFAWVCDYPFLSLKDRVKLVAVPIYQGRPLYRAYIIVSASDVHTTNLQQLKGSVFAYADPYSNTGYLAPRYHLRELGEDPRSFFASTFFTWSHRKIVEAVAVGLAGAGAVDGYVWDTLALVRPELTRATRIIWRSPDYAFPPFVATRGVGESAFVAFQRMLFEMDRDDEGKALLRRLNIDGFTEGRLSMYDTVAKMMAAFGEQ
jgi:phosphonate transport system substrate-binding protein